MAAPLALRILITARDEASKVLGKLVDGVKAVGVGVAATVGALGVGFGAFLKGAVGTAEQLEREMGALRGAIEATGGAAGFTADELDAMARRLDEATLGSASGFRQAATALLTFKSVGQDAFERTLLLAQDLADAGFGSVQSSAVQLGKALEDPQRGLTALTRVGVTFTEQQKKLIESLVATGRSAEAQGVILDAVAGQVGGVASSMGSGLSGAVDLVGKRMTDLKEQLGQGLLPILTDINLRLADFLGRLTASGKVKAFGDAIGTAFKNGFEVAVKWVEALNLDELIARVKTFAETTGERLVQWGATVKEWADSTQAILDKLSAGLGLALNTAAIPLKLFGAIVLNFGGVFGKVFQGILYVASKAAQGIGVILGPLGGGLRNAAEEGLLLAESLGASADENLRKSTEMAHSIKDNFAAIGQHFADLTDTTERSATASDHAADSTQQLNDEYAAQQALLDALVMAEDAQALALQKTARASDEAAAATLSLNDRLIATRAEYERLLAAGDDQGAAALIGTMRELNEAIRASGEQATDAAGHVARYRDALKDARTEVAQLQAAEQAGLAAAQELTRVQALQAANLERLNGARGQSLPVMQAVAAEADRLAAIEQELTAAVTAGRAASLALADAQLHEVQVATQLAEALAKLVEQRELELQIAGNATRAIEAEGRLRLTHLANLHKEAVARGDLVKAGQIEAQQRKAELANLQALLAAKQAEVAAAQAAALAKLQEAEANGIVGLELLKLKTDTEELIAAKEREVAAIQESIRAKKEEAKIDREAAAATQEQGAASDQTAEKSEKLADSVSKVRTVTLTMSEVMRRAGMDLEAFGKYAGVAEEAFGKLYHSLSQAQRGHIAFYGNAHIMEQAKNAATMAAAHAKAIDDLAAALDRARGAFDQGDLSLADYIATLERMQGQFAHLGDEQLTGLRDALADAKRQMEDFSRSAEDGLISLQREWALLNDQREEALILEQQMQRLKLEQQLAEARARGNAEEIAALEKQLALLDKIHAKKLETLRADEKSRQEQEQERARQDQERDRRPPARSDDDRSPVRPPPASPVAPSPAPSPASQARPTETHIHIAGVLDLNDRVTLANLGRKLQPVFADLERRRA